MPQFLGLRHLTELWVQVLGPHNGTFVPLWVKIGQPQVLTK